MAQSNDSHDLANFLNELGDLEGFGENIPPAHLGEVVIEESPNPKNKGRRASRFDVAPAARNAKAATPRAKSRAEMVGDPSLVKAPKRRSAAGDAAKKFRFHDEVDEEEEEEEAVESIAPSRKPAAYKGQMAHVKVSQPPAQPSRYGTYYRSDNNRGNYQNVDPATEKRLQQVREVRGRRMGQVESALLNADVNLDEAGQHSWQDRQFLYVKEQGVKVRMCSDCTRFYFTDKGKVQSLGADYAMLTFVLCPSCVEGNNECNRLYKAHFGWKKEQQ